MANEIPATGLDINGYKLTTLDHKLVYDGHTISSGSGVTFTATVAEDINEGDCVCVVKDTDPLEYRKTDITDDNKKLLIGFAKATVATGGSLDIEIGRLYKKNGAFVKGNKYYLNSSGSIDNTITADGYIGIAIDDDTLLRRN